ncbi:conserved hypothetical protein [Paecilomyces variotii No. 5]|uniref:Mucin-7 n=1 Tax=Byssochlamys spectabilis (strain No. 5 / NBRC 109023) TaxID=1356009 RepID=V5FXU8_BYSSN|nr:conserved hypothetical protein [Paecilomyces variotii No. 5]
MSAGGVRSLLAKFENQSQNDNTSPPSRGRSPAGSDNSGNGRPLSKVRASFIAVENVGRSGPFGGLRKSNDGETPLSPSRLRSSEVDDPYSSITAMSEKENNVPPNNGSGDSVKPEEKRPESNGSSEARSALGNILRGSPPEKSQSQDGPTAASTEASTAEERPQSVEKTETAAEKESATPKPATKEPSNLSLPRDNSSSKLNGKASPTRRAKSPVPPRTQKSTTTSASQGTPKNTNAGRQSSGKEPTKTAATKPSRPSLNPPAKITSRSTPTSTPSRDSAKKTTTKSSPNGKARSKSPTRPVRLPASMTAPTAASAAKTGAPSRSPSRAQTPSSGLTRKSSTLKKDATGASPRVPASNVPRQPSRASLASPGSDRPKSRTSNVGTKPVDDSFLARMMRPTASSASKTHEKVEAKTPPRTRSTRTPRRSPAKSEQSTRTPSRGKEAKAVPKKEETQPHDKEQPEKESNVHSPPAPVPEAVPEEPEKEKATVDRVETAAEDSKAATEVPETSAPSSTEAPAEAPADVPVYESKTETVEPASEPSPETAAEKLTEVLTEQPAGVDAPADETAKEAEVQETPAVPTEITESY